MPMKSRAARIKSNRDRYNRLKAKGLCCKCGGHNPRDTVKCASCQRASTELARKSRLAKGRPVRRCSSCWGFGHYYTACPQDGV